LKERRVDVGDRHVAGRGLAGGQRRVVVEHVEPTVVIDSRLD
jgi:hypothetical protein